MQPLTQRTKMSKSRFSPLSAPGVIAGLLLSLLFSGCSGVEDERVRSLRSALVLADVPAGEQSISSIRSLLQADDAPAEIDVVIRGRIDAGDLPPWEQDMAAFVLTDATGHDGDEDHDPHTCPFCSRNINNYLAKVSFEDKGAVIDIDSRQLFDVEEKQLILIRGKAAIDDDNLLKVDADGLYHVP